MSTTTRITRRRALHTLAVTSLGGLAAGAMPLHAHAAALNRQLPVPPEVRQSLSQARMQGSGRFRYFAFHVYDAHLWVLPGFDAAKLLAQPFALSLTYARSLSASDIAERSIEEMRRQASISDVDAQRWLKAMTAAFADVREGDRLTGVYLPSGAAAFFLNGQATQRLDDARFAALFFGIWLSSATSAPDLRRELLGG